MNISFFPKLLLVALLCAALAPGGAGQSNSLDQVRTLNNLGVSHLERFEYRAAADEFRKALAIKPDYVPALVNAGIALYYDTDYAGAKEVLRRAAELESRQPSAHFLLGFVATKEMQWEDALREFQAVVDVEPEDASGNYNLGLTYMRTGNLQKALVLFEKVLQVEPRHIAATYNLGMALMRSGRRDEAQKVMARLRELKGEESIGSPMGSMSSQYGEEGRLALAIPSEVGIEKSEALPVRFVDVTTAAGIASRGGSRGEKELLNLPVRSPAAAYSRERALKNLVPRFGSGVTFLDFDNDGKLDLFAASCGANRLFRNNGDGTYADVTREAGIAAGGCTMGVAVGDYDNDGYADIFLSAHGGNVLYHNQKNGTFRNVTLEAGVGGESDEWSLSAAFFDYDHDGDLDLYVNNFVDLTPPAGMTTLAFPHDFKAQPARLYRNNGNGTFVDVASKAGVQGGSQRATAVVFTDFNESRDIDFFTAGYGAPIRLYSNNRDGTFTDVAAKVGLTRTAATFGFSVADLNADGFPDLVVPALIGSAGPAVFYSEAGRSFRETHPAAGKTAGSGPCWASAIIDYDNDSLPDILSLCSSLSLLRNQGGSFVDVSAGTGLSSVRLEQARSLAVGDYDGDGDLDIVVGGASPLLLRNDGGNRNNHLTLKLDSLSDNKSGYGSKIEVRSGPFRVNVDATGGCGFLSQGNPEVFIGLGGRKSIDSVRVLWPSGVLQSEMDVAVNGATRIQQVDRKGTSCPILYAWDGSQYRFVTDFLGGSAIGNLVAPGTYNTPDTDEYILVAGSQLKDREGTYSIKMNDQLEEVIMVDQARLVVIDHPADVNVFPNERLLPAPPFPEFRVYTTHDSKAPVRAVDDRGTDVLPQLREIDRRYPDGFRLLPFKGYAETHSLTLDLGDLSGAKRALLLATAWIDYADSSSNLAASQAGVRLIPPYLEVVDRDGQWVRALDQMGFPAGLPKTMTVDLTGRFINPKDYRVRITTNMRIYWDQILVDTNAEPAQLRATTLEPSAARLDWGGYPREYSPDGKKPRLYDYSDRADTAPWKSHLGNYTRYGDVRELLAARDSMTVVMHHGDEITIDFDARRLAPPPSGWARSFLVYAAGFGKDMDLNSAYSDTVGPLPYLGMPGYPYAGEMPVSAGFKEYQLKYNTRRIDSFLPPVDGRPAH